MNIKACAVIVAVCVQVVLGLPVDSSQCKVDVVFCVDNSASISAKNWPLVLDLVKGLVSKLNIGPDSSHAGLVDFGNKGYKDFDLAAHTTESAVNTAVAALKFKDEGTNMHYGLEEAKKLLDATAPGVRVGVPKLLVFITDGVPNDPAETNQQVALIKAANIRLVTIGIGSTVNATFLKSVASTQADFTPAKDFSSLATISGLVVNKDTCKPPPPAALKCKVDVVFCLDNSGSIGLGNWTLVLGFVQNLITRLNIESTGSYVGLVDFGDSVHMESDFKPWWTEKDLLKSVAEWKYKGEGTNMSAGLHFSRIMLDPVYAHPESVPKLIVFITDGQAYGTDLEAIKREVNDIRKKNIRLVTIGIGSAVDKKFLEAIASTAGDYQYANDFKSLSPIADQIMKDALCKPPPSLKVSA